MRRTFRIFRQAAKISISASLAYRANFIFLMVINIVSNLLLPLVTILIYGAGAAIPGWSFHEALLVQSCFMLCTGFCSPLFYNMVWQTMSHIKEGSYDLLMVKPGSIIVITLANSFDLESTGVLIGGIAMFAYSLWHLPQAGLWHWLSFLYFFVLGVIVSLGLVLIMSATVFKWVGNSRIFEMYDAVTELGRYPGTIYPKILLYAVTFVIPVAVLGFFPAASILGRTEWYMYLSGIPCVLFLLLGWFLFRYMIRKYQSAGG